MPFPTISPPETIDGVIDRLVTVESWARDAESRLGYFAVLYRRVTERVRTGIADGRFEDGGRMERLDVRFANRYFVALNAHMDSSHASNPSHAWRVAFDAAGAWRPIVLQHLLLGMNAHINLDLAIAAARTCPGSAVADLERDFREINAVLMEMLDDVQDALAIISPWGGIVDLLGGRLDELLAEVGLTGARDWAWMTALQLAPLNTDEQEPVIDRIDRSIAGAGRAIRQPGSLFSTIAMVVRLGELRGVGAVMDALDA